MSFSSWRKPDDQQLELDCTDADRWTPVPPDDRHSLRDHQFFSDLIMTESTPLLHPSTSILSALRIRGQGLGVKQYLPVMVVPAAGGGPPLQLPR